MLVCVASMDDAINKYRVEEIAREKERKRKESEEAKRKKRLKADKSLTLSDKIVHLLSPLEEQWMAKRLLREEQVCSTQPLHSDTIDDDDDGGDVEMRYGGTQGSRVWDSSAMTPLVSPEVISLVSRRNPDRSGLLLWACEEGLAHLARTYIHACIDIYMHACTSMHTYTYTHTQTHTHTHPSSLLTF